MDNPKIRTVHSRKDDQRLDLEIGRVMKALEHTKVADNTLVIVTSDNGGEQKVSRNLPLGGPSNC